jgi:hypothetical protein
VIGEAEGVLYGLELLRRLPFVTIGCAATTPTSPVGRLGLAAGTWQPVDHL